MNYQTFVINMKRSPERLEFMTEQFKRLGMDFEVQEGVDGRTYNFSDVYDENVSIKYNGTPLTPVERGCALSHKIILEKTLESDLEYVLILEDDVELPDNFKEIVERVIKDNDGDKTDWEYLSFNYPYVGIRNIKLWLYLFFNMFKRDKSLLKILKIPMYFVKFILISIFSLLEGLREKIYKQKYKLGKVVKFYRPIYFAGCYLVKRTGAEKILSIGNGIIYPADRVQNVARIKKSLKLYAFCPMVAKQRRDKFESTLNNQDVSSILDILV